MPRSIPIDEGSLYTPSRDDWYTPSARNQRDIHMQEGRWTPAVKEFWDYVDSKVPFEQNRTDALLRLRQGFDGPDLPRWCVTWVFAEQDGQLVVRSLTVEPNERATPAGGLTASMLRELSPPGACREAARLRERSEKWDGVSARHYNQVAKSVAAHGPIAMRRQGPGRPSLTDQFLALVAEAYLAELAGGRGVLHRVGLRLGNELRQYKAAVPVETVRDWVRIARRRGFLGEAPKQGKRGGLAGPRLLELRAAGSQDEGEVT